MENNKICPLLLACPADIPPECRGDRCAWWDYSACACCLASLAAGNGGEGHD